MLTLSMIVKNEEKYLEDCLKSVEGVVDEIVVVDTGSSDKTIEIAKRYNAKIFHFDWVNDFSAARNYAIEKSSGDWILYLDADERLSKDSVSELRELQKHNLKTAYFCQIENSDTIRNRPSVMMYVRLFPKNNNVKFEGAIHEQIEYSLRRNRFQIKQSGIKIIHVGYNIEKGQLINKAKRNLKLLLKEYEKEKTGYYAYQIAQTYGVMEDKKNAEKYFLTALKDEYLFKEYRSIAYRYLAINSAERNELQNANDFINMSLKYDCEQPLALMAASKINLKLNNIEKAAHFCKDAWENNNKFLKSSKKTYQTIFLDEKSILYEGLKIGIIWGNKEYFNIFYRAFKKITDAAENLDEFEMFNNLLNKNNITAEDVRKYIPYIDEKNIEVILSLLQQYDKPDIVSLYYKELNKNFSNNSAFLNKYAFYLSSKKEYAKAEKILERSIVINNNDASTIFYLVALYIQNNSFDKIKVIISNAEKHFSKQPEIIKRIELLKKKLSLP